MPSHCLCATCARTCRVRFVIGYEDGSIRTWHSYNGFIVAVIPKAHAGAVNAMVAAPAGGNFYSAGADGFIRVWEARGV